MVRQAVGVLEEHDLDGIAAKIDRIRDQEDPTTVPDDLYEELKRLEEKIRRAGDESTYEYKLPTRVQITIPDLWSIFVELLDILRKLYGRSLPRNPG